MMFYAILVFVFIIVGTMVAYSMFGQPGAPG